MALGKGKLKPIVAIILRLRDSQLFSRRSFTWKLDQGRAKEEGSYGRSAGKVKQTLFYLARLMNNSTFGQLGKEKITMVGHLRIQAEKERKKKR